MLKRTITGAVFVAVIVGFFLLRMVSNGFFQILIGLFALIGTWEVNRALGERIISAQRISTLCFSVLSVLAGWLFGVEEALYVLLGGVMLQLVLAVVFHEKISLEGLACGVLATAYPSAMLVAMSGANMLASYSTVALLTVFVVSPCADTFAYLVGSMLKGPKLCPNVSPKKTISGAIGGVVGGAIGTLAIYFIYGVALSNPVPPVWFMITVGLLTAVLTELGDLVESIIKRKAGIKDMGRLLPGHGGVMDRIDGMLFATPFVYACFRLLLFFLA